MCVVMNIYMYYVIYGYAYVCMNVIACMTVCTCVCINEYIYVMYKNYMYVEGHILDLKKCLYIHIHLNVLSSLNKDIIIIIIITFIIIKFLLTDFITKIYLKDNLISRKH